MMRILAFVLLSSTFLMCKSKNAIPSDQLISYIVILEKGASPKHLKKDISYKLENHEQQDKMLNQWMLAYNGDPIEENSLRAELLNHPKVISVFTKEYFEKLKLKDNSKIKSGISNKRGNERQ